MTSVNLNFQSVFALLSTPVGGWWEGLIPLQLKKLHDFIFGIIYLFIFEMIHRPIQRCGWQNHKSPKLLDLGARWSPIHSHPPTAVSAAFAEDAATFICLLGVRWKWKSEKNNIFLLKYYQTRFQVQKIVFVFKTKLFIKTIPQQKMWLGYKQHD